MTELNAAAARAMLSHEVHAATDITGFGLAGHACKMADGSGVTLRIEESDLPLMPGALDCCREGMIPGGGQAQSRILRRRACRISDEVARRDGGDLLRSADLGRAVDRAA